MNTKLNWAMQAVPLAKEQKNVLVNIILQLAEQSSQEIPTYEAATEEKLGLVKQAATVAEISGDTIEDVKTAVNSLIANLKTAGNSNHSDDELDDIISSLTKLNRGIKRISKREACERILHCSPSTFDNYIKLGLIPRGHKEYGFKELNWSEKDFDKATLARIKKYKDKQGL